jgi:hypothetical protein
MWSEVSLKKIFLYLIFRYEVTDLNNGVVSNFHETLLRIQFNKL